MYLAKITSLTLSLLLLSSVYCAEQALLTLQHPFYSLEEGAAATTAGQLRTNTIPISTLKNNNDSNSNLRHLQERPSCPNQEPCHDFGNGWLGYSVRKTDETGYCREICAAGGSLTFYTSQEEGYTCGECELPKCPEQDEPCHDFGNGYLGYLVYEMQPAAEGTGGTTCRQVCAAGNSLAVKLANGQYVCGTCPSYSCPDQEPCRDFGNGLYGYSVYKVTETGLCETSCAAGTYLENYRNQGYTCGECAMTELPPDNEELMCTEQDLCGQENGWVGAYSLYKFDGTICTQACASGYHITDRLNDGFQCGTCPGYEEIDNPVQLPSCPNQEPCAEDNGLISYSLFKVNEDGVTCTEACASGYYVTSLQDQGFACGYCPRS